jgi:hypothetical protein
VDLSSDSEEAYGVARKAVADKSLKAWLTKTNSGFETDQLPMVCPPPTKTLGDFTDTSRLPSRRVEVDIEHYFLELV